jgi:heme exporter protein D
VHSLLLALAATPEPTPSGTLRPGLSEDQISPGIWGFLATAFVVVITILLIVDMVRRLRRVRYRTEVAEEQQRQAREAGATEVGAPEVDSSGAEGSNGEKSTR